MHFKSILSATTLVAVASAQSNMPNLTTLLGTTPSLSGLAQVLHAFPNITGSLLNQTNITLFAPNNQAVSALQSSGTISANYQSVVQALLSYHVAPGMIYASNITTTPTFCHTDLNSTMYSNVTGGQVVEARLVGQTVEITSGLKMVANVTQANLNFTGGVVHVIDSVLFEPLNVSSTADAAGLTALVGALTETNLSSTLDTAKDITVFAPSNAAFEAIGSAAGKLNATQLASILGYHVLNGTVAYSSSLGNGTVPSMSGSNLTFTVAGGAAFVDGARIINADILISGGVMHVIDSVLNPNNSTAKANPSASAPAVQYSGASSASLGSLTQAIPAASTTVAALVATTPKVAQGYPTHSLAAAVGSSASAAASSKTKSGAAAMPTGAIGAAALFGGAALVANW